MKEKLEIMIKNIIKEEFVAEKKKQKKSEVEDIDFDIDASTEAPTDAPIDVPAGDTAPDLDMDMSGADSIEKQVGKGLQMALDAAKQLPDGENKSKLIRQIGNTALFFLKTQIQGTGEQM